MKNWMSNLSEEQKTKPLIHLAIPGSHDCMTYTIKSNSEISPDNEPAVNYFLKVFGRWGRKYIHKWCVTQDMTLTQQLNAGIRYLDFRVAAKANSKVYFCHGLYGDEVSNYLNEINKFLDENKGEIVILDFQHFYNFTGKIHDKLINEHIKSAFGNKLCPYIQPTKDVTLAWMLNNGYRVIVIYRDKATENKKIEGLWPGPAWLTPWPNTSNVNSLHNFIQKKLTSRHENKGFVTQCLLTPDAKLLALHPFSNLKNACATPVVEKVKPWLTGQRPGPDGINVVISDFVGSGGFNKIVIGLNN